MVGIQSGGCSPLRSLAEKAAVRGEPKKGADRDGVRRGVGSFQSVVHSLLEQNLQGYLFAHAVGWLWFDEILRK